MLFAAIHSFMDTPVLGTQFPGLEKVLFLHDTVPVLGCALVALVMFACVTRWIIRGNFLRRAGGADAAFMEAFRHSAHALALFEQGVPVQGSPRGALYTNACRELAFHLVGSDTVDKNFSLRLRAAGRITTTQWEATRFAARRSRDESVRWLGVGRRGFATNALLLLGALGFILSLMEHAGSGTLDLLALASSLRPLALAMVCHVIGRAWESRLGDKATDTVSALEDFSSELGTLMERGFVDHRYPIETLPSLEGMGISDGPSFGLPPSEVERSFGR